MGGQPIEGNSADVATRVSVAHKTCRSKFRSGNRLIFAKFRSSNRVIFVKMGWVDAELGQLGTSEK
jgi:hypothetical protein